MCYNQSMADKKDRLDQRFGRLVVVGDVESTYYPNCGKSVRNLICVCDCGEQIIVNINALRAGHTRSCKCLFAEGNNKSHGLSGERFYNIWASMKGRCGGNDRCYKYITYSQEWEDFENFKKDMYDSYLDHCEKFGIKETTIDRKNNLLGYSLGNCRWATWNEQIKNKTGNRIFNKKNRHVDTGIYHFKWGKRKKRWIARIMYKRKTINLGYFSLKKEARIARSKAEIKYNRIYE